MFFTIFLGNFYDHLYFSKEKYLVNRLLQIKGPKKNFVIIFQKREIINEAGFK